MAQVRLILREDVINLGDAGDVVNVKPGYARNYLVPRGMAIPATEANVKQLEHHKRVIEEKLAKEMSDLEAVKSKIEGLSLEVTAQAGAEGKLFGSVTAQNVADLLKENGVTIDRRKIALGEPIKSLGEHEVTVKLRREFLASVKLTVNAAAKPAEDVRTIDEDEPPPEYGGADEGDDD